MKSLKVFVALSCALSLLSISAVAADKAAEKKTCCQEAAANGKECRHKCCVAAHKDGKSCEKCNPGKEDLKIKKDDKKGPKKS